VAPLWQASPIHRMADVHARSRSSIPLSTSERLLTVTGNGMFHIQHAVHLIAGLLLLIWFALCWIIGTPSRLS
jgi:hypothetical protein